MNPITPVKAVGILILPPISAPIDMGIHLEATKAASPPVLPPQVRELSKGFKACPSMLF